MKGKVQKFGHPNKFSSKQGSIINKPIAGWKEKVKASLDKGDEPEKDFFEGIGNEFDKNEWTW